MLMNLLATLMWEKVLDKALTTLAAAIMLVLELTELDMKVRDLEVFFN